MSLFNWLVPQKGRSFAASAHGRHRRATGLAGSPPASARQLRRNQRREQLYTLVRESMIRVGVLSTSYQFKALTLDADGDGFMVLIDLDQPHLAMPEAQRMQTEHWLQEQAQRRHAMAVRAVYWRFKSGAVAAAAPPRPLPTVAPPHAAATEALMDDAVSAWAGLQAAPATAADRRVQAVTADEVLALQQALKKALQPASRTALPSSAQRPPASMRSSVRPDVAAHLLSGEPADRCASDAPSAFSPLGQTQYGKL